MITPEIYSVTKLNNMVKALFDNEPAFSCVFVTGEISNFKAHYSGHLYMTIKDDGAAIKAVMFAGNASRLKFMPENGMKVLIRGSVSLYPRDGSYQLYISDMQPDGTGALNIAFEQLKKKLSGEGLFSDAHKKPLPLLPGRIGVITSGTGAAIQDIFNVLGRRYPIGEIILRSTKVQGEGAAEDIASAIRLFNKYKAADVLIVGRGGGSIEDLWAFNEEIVARAVFDSEIPVISAVGHETDYTICDFVADFRAPTPSAAAECVAPDINDLRERLYSAEQYMYTLMDNYIANEKNKLSLYKNNGAFRDPIIKLRENHRDLMYFSEKLTNIVSSTLEASRLQLMAVAEKLDALSPLAVIKRGYAITEIDNEFVTSVKDIKRNDEVKVSLCDGSFKAIVTDITEKE